MGAPMRARRLLPAVMIRDCKPTFSAGSSSVGRSWSDHATALAESGRKDNVCMKLERTSFTASGFAVTIYLGSKARYCDYPSFWPPIRVRRGVQFGLASRGRRVHNLLLVHRIAALQRWAFLCQQARVEAPPDKIHPDPRLLPRLFLWPTKFGSDKQA